VWKQALSREKRARDLRNIGRLSEAILRKGRISRKSKCYKDDKI
jgi:hypothetical protein